MEPQTSFTHLGRNLFILRKIHRLSQKEMAKRLGIGVGSLRRLESGTLPPRFNIHALEQIYVNFNILPTQILTQELFP